jgi:hypothetical protein
VNTASRESNGSFHWRFLVEATFAAAPLLATGLAVLELALVDFALGAFGLTDFLGPVFVVFSNACDLDVFDAAFLGVFLSRVALTGAVFVDVLLDVERVRRVGVSLPGGLLIVLLTKNSYNGDDAEVYNAYVLLNTAVLNRTYRATLNSALQSLLSYSESSLV